MEFHRTKIGAFCVLVAAATLAAGLFGALNSQLIHAVSAEFFTEMVFVEYRVAEHIQNTFGVSWVGFRAAWWMGPILSIPVFILGILLVEDPNKLMAIGGRAIGTALIITLSGSAIGYLLATFAVPDAISVNEQNYLRASTMWTAVYWTGTLALPAALWMMFLGARRAREDMRAR